MDANAKNDIHLIYGYLVTKCPGAFTPELAKLHADRDEEYRGMTPAQKRRKTSDRHWYRKKVGKNGG